MLITYSSFPLKIDERMSALLYLLRLQVSLISQQRNLAASALPSPSLRPYADLAASSSLPVSCVCVFAHVTPVLSAPCPLSQEAFPEPQGLGLGLGFLF